MAKYSDRALQYRETEPALEGDGPSGKWQINGGDIRWSVLGPTHFGVARDREYPVPGRLDPVNLKRVHYD